jgi:hypothetical protein
VSLALLRLEWTRSCPDYDVCVYLFVCVLQFSVCHRAHDASVHGDLLGVLRSNDDPTHRRREGAPPQRGQINRVKCLSVCLSICLSASSKRSDTQGPLSCLFSPSIGQIYRLLGVCVCLSICLPPERGCIYRFLCIPVSLADCCLVYLPFCLCASHSVLWSVRV